MPRARINGVELYYQDTGGDLPVLLLIAGLGATGHIWGALPRRLRSQLRVISYDHRWLGRSIGEARPLAFRELVADARGLLDHLGIQRCHVLGKSLGGMIAERLVLDDQDRFLRLALISSTPRITPHLHRIGEFFHVLAQTLSAKDYLHTVFTFCFSPEFHDRHTNTPLKAERAMAQALGDVRAVARHVESFRDLDYSEELRSLRVPTLVVSGLDDLLVPPAQHRELAELIPGAELLELPGVGHSPIAESGEPTIRRIIEFLERAEIKEIAARG